MKKTIFTALVAIVAIGAAFAGNASSRLATNVGSPLNTTGPCASPTALNQPSCDPTFSGAQCTIAISGSPAFTTNTNGRCTLVLKRP